MKKEMQANEIERKIEALKNELATVRGRETEVYSRIVGYYRAVKNWNRGKREEYGYRRTYAYPTRLPEANPRRRGAEGFEEAPVSATPGAIASYQYFFRSTCPNCPPVRQYLSGLGLRGDEINVDHDEGFSLAGDLAVCATPTVIFRDAEGTELFRAANLQELMGRFETEEAVS